MEIIMSNLKKSTRHNKIAGDFGEEIILYFLSKHGFEVISVDHTGIDLIGCNKNNNNQRIGISIKSRTRNSNHLNDNPLVKGNNYDKIKNACDFFMCDPWIGFCIDRVMQNDKGEIRIILMSLSTLDEYQPNFKYGKDINFSMSDKSIKKYEKDNNIYNLVFDYKLLNWF